MPERVTCDATWETREPDGFHLVVTRHACTKTAGHASPNDRHRCGCGMPRPAESTNHEKEQP